MNRLDAKASFAAVLFLTAAAILAAGGESVAQEADVKAALDAYHRALETLDVSKVEPLWAHGDRATLVDPTSESIAIGWDAVQKNWRMQFNAASALKFRQIDGPHIQIKGDIAWSTEVVNFQMKFKSGAEICSPTFETDIFEKSDDKWLLVSHVSALVPKFPD
jgi:ketosteroid isomerase-like protein